MAIGAQNAYVLKLGLLRLHVFWICFICGVFDTILITAGVSGLGALVDSQPDLLKTITLFGAVFLLGYAAFSFKSALKPKVMQESDEKAKSLLSCILILASLTFLNPHVYLDTVVLVGAFSAQYQGDARIAFGIGAALASFVWFFSLGYGARLLIPYFQKPKAWQILDLLIGFVMLLLAILLLWNAFG